MGHSHSKHKHDLFVWADSFRYLFICKTCPEVYFSPRDVILQGLTKGPRVRHSRWLTTRVEVCKDPMNDDLVVTDQRGDESCAACMVILARKTRREQDGE